MTTKNKARKPKTIRATPKQAEAIRGVIIDKKSVRKAMIDAGYSINTADNPMTLTTSKAFIQAMDSFGMTDDFLIQRHKALVNSEREEIALRAVDTAYKVRGKYNTERTRNTFNAPVLIQITPPTDIDVDRISEV